MANTAALVAVAAVAAAASKERQQHLGPITQLLFTPDGSRLLSCGEDGRVVVYATHHGCLPIKALTTPHPAADPSAAAAAAAAGTPGGKGRKTAGSSSSKGRAVGSSVCAAVSTDGRWIAVGQAAGGVSDVSSSSSSSGGGSNGGAALVLFDGGLEAVLQIESAARRFDRWGSVTGVWGRDGGGDRHGVE